MDYQSRRLIWRVALIGIFLAFCAMQCRHFQSALPYEARYGEYWRKEDARGRRPGP